jgi:hypothetical protein
MKKNFEQFRPKDFVGSGDKHLYPLITSLSKRISLLEKNYFFSTLKLDKNQNFIMSNLLIEFAEDLHNDIGLWKSIEYYNQSMFNTPLPLFVNENYQIENTFDINRIKFFIHTIFYEFDDELVLSPEHKDLHTLAKGVSDFLNLKFQDVPKNSGIKLYFNLPNDYGWDFKQKLVWIGLSSYLFRYSYFEYIQKNNNGKVEISIVDDFINQENTYWSGLGIIDIVAKALELPDKIQKDVRSWYERLFAYYKVISLKNNVLELENIINEQIYKVQLDDNLNNYFKVDEIIFGGIVPYGDFYYWSGVQHFFGKLNKEAFNLLKNDFLKNSIKIVYRYDKNLLNKALDDVKVHYSDFKNFFNNDLVIFQDGLTMAAALQKKDKQKYQALPKDELDKIMKKYNLKNPFPNIDLPDYLLNADEGIAVYFNPDIGIEIMTDFNNVKNGFEKQGVNLTEDEKEAIREFIESDTISPNFVMKLVNENGDKSIASSFLISSELNFTEFLLHKYKGHFYKNKYPEISYVDK